ncbi:MAG: zinc ABC transporter substrate-binding protein [Acidobacteria bacterium]|nr:zinc ABC transporter substrate-binding protein [Acidobacteriota bacterium]
MKSYLRIVAAVLAAASLISPAGAQGKKLTVVCTLPTMKALVEEVGGNRVEVVALARGDQDPHFVSPTPVLMRKTREASLFIENGFSLELWADEVVNGSGNSKIFRGTTGRVVAATGISALEVPSVLSREMGDIHPQGNPHVWLDPLLAKVEAGNIVEALKRADPAGSSYYDSRKSDFDRRIDVALFGEELLKLVGIQKLTRLTWSGELHNFLTTNKIGGQPLASKAGGWLKAAESLRGVKAYEFHKVWVYFARAFGLQLVGTIEERPGIPPGPQHVRQVMDAVNSQKVPLILVDNFYNPALPYNIARETGAEVVLLPNQVEGEPGIKTYFDLMDHLIREMTVALAKASK